MKRANPTRDVRQAIGQAQAAIRRFNARFRALSHLASDVDAQVELLQRELDAGRTRGPVHGLAVTVKGSIPVAGLPWTEGSAIHAGRIARHDAAIVSRARAAGGVLLGTSTLSELAMYGVENPFEPMGLNPWDPARTAGGSSSGAGVAAALGMAQVNIGTDSGGSVRNPACHCGVVGFMPSRGALTLEGQPNHVPSLTTVGLIARTVEEVELAWEALASVPGEFEAGASRRVLLPRRLIDDKCCAETLSLFRAALARLAQGGFDLVEGEVAGWSEGELAAGVVSLAEGGRALAGMDLSKASEGIRARAANAARLSAAEVDAARIACASLRASLARSLERAEAGAVLTPTWPFAAPEIHAQSVEVQGRTVPVDPHRNCFVRAANAPDACAITLPMGLYRTAQVPAGLHLVAPGGRERGLLALARAAEACLPVLPPPPPLRD
jgi:Asp-tRNA(Asn)/Glu-tRNA(Gln) amidotransferase A subunit family amidase